MPSPHKHFPGNRNCQLEHASDRFTEEDAARMASHLKEMQESIDEDPQKPVDPLRLMSDSERHRLPVQRRRCELDYPRDKCIHQLFEAQVERTPDAVAVVFEDQSLTYRELNERANQLAHYLQRLGVKPEILIGLFMERSLEMVIAVLGILKAGGAYVPMDPKYPAERLAFMLTDAESPLVVTQKDLASSLVGSKARLVFLDSECLVISHELKANPPSNSQPDDLAYVIYTSGSTGTPKGSLISHYNVVRLFQATQEWFHFAEADVWTLFHSIAFDFSVWELWGPLFYGGKLVVVPFDVSRTPKAFHQLLHDEGVTVLNQTPSAFRQLIHADEKSEHKNPKSALALRLVIFGGEFLDFQSLKPWIDLHGDQHPRLVNMYGITETTVHVTYHPICKEDLAGRSSIGRPIPDLNVYLLDEQKKLLPVGVPGEICVGGAGVGRGYLNRMELTAQKFIPDPFNPGPENLLYCSGDLGRFLSNGDIEYLGRIDQQVKIRGFRIELGEIEMILEGHPHIRNAVADVCRIVPDDPSLKVYLVVEDGVTLASEELHMWLQHKLPDHMIPSKFVKLAALPLTINGKVDRKALKTLDAVELASNTAYVAPRNELQSTLVEVWQAVLRRERVGIHENFFHLGGHSLLAMQVITRIAKTLGVSLPVGDFFEAPTIANLAERLGQAHPTAIPPIEPLPRQGPLPLSFAQERLWFLHQYETESKAYNTPLAYHLVGPLDVTALERGLGEIIRRHEVLRTTLRIKDNHPIQWIVPASPVELPVVDCAEMPSQQRDQALQQQITGYLQAPFDLSAGPVFSSKLIRLATDEHLLLFNFHHAFSDGWSLEVFRRELSILYADYQAERAVSLPALPVQYAHYAVWQRQWLHGQELERQLEYWRHQLADAPSLELPTDHPRPPRQTYAGAKHTFRLPPELTTQLKTFNRQEGATPFMTLLAIFQLMLSRYSGQEDILVGTPIANRQQVELESLLGFFVNTLVLRGDLSGEPGFREVVARVRQAALDAYQHQDLPFEKLVVELNPVRDLSRHPLFQVMFAVQNAPEHPLDLVGLEIAPYPLPQYTTHFDLELHFWQKGDDWNGLFLYNTDLFHRDTMGRMAGHYLELLKHALEEPERAVSQLPMLRAAERHQLLVEWNNTAAEYPRDKCVHQLFEEQVERTPEGVAVVFEGQQLTYRELNERANQLAHHLVALGTGPDLLVGIHLPHTTEMLIAVLAVLKAGGAYVPLSSSYPRERLRFMVEDSRSPILLTHSTLPVELSAPGVQVIPLDSIWGQIGQTSRTNPIATTSLDNLLYVMYTSGSTGRPKGVPLPHRAGANLIHWQLRNSRQPQGARTLLFSPLSFDASFTDMFMAWCSGGTLVMASEEVRMDPSRLAEFLQCQAVERINLPYVALNALAGFATASNPAVILPALKEVLSTAEQLQITPAIREWFGKHPGATLQNQYGPTETHVVTALHLANPPERWPALPSIGKPIANTQIRILDRHGEPVPIGVAGNLYISGHGLARGYLNRPDLTGERFVPDPFSQGEGMCMYQTGDLAQWRFDGTIEFLGRTDQLIKIRGYRVEPGEIETLARECAGVREVVIQLWEKAPGDQRLVAHVVAGGDVAFSSKTLREHLGRRLPDYMVPSLFFIVDQLPLTSSGKVDRKALPLPDPSQLDLDTERVLPRTPQEEFLAGIWVDVLGLDHVGVYDDFFALGGHSLLAFTIVSRLTTSLGIQVPVRWIFEHRTIEALARQIEPRVVGVQAFVPIHKTADQPTQPVSFAHHAQLGEWNHPGREASCDRNIYDLFSARVERTPDAVAVECEGKSLTYAELDMRANQVAQPLREAGVGRDVVVGLHLERSLDMAVAALAVLKAGGAIAPLDPELPRERLGRIITDGQLPVLLSDSSLEGQLPATEAKVLCLDRLPAQGGTASPELQVSPDSLAYVIFTSGTTGQPKGVAVSQRAYLNYHSAAMEFLDLKETDRCLHFASFSFDIGIDQLLTPLLTGATVVMRGTEIGDPSCLSDVIRAHRLTVLHLPPVYWQAWVEAMTRIPPGASIATLRLVEVGGDVMPVAAVRDWRSLKPNPVRLINRYGPTETTMFTTAYEVPSEPPDGEEDIRRIPIGRPVGPRTIHVLDTDGNPVQAGVSGEIWIGGATLARGYLHHAALTAERFVPDPFNNQPGARLYRTGDLGRILPDGNLDFLGRLDFQVKLRGYRIESGEIETALANHPKVRIAIVTAREDSDGDKSLWAFIVPATEWLPSDAELRAFLARKLPDYMIPSHFVALDALPLTSNGKLDRKALENMKAASLAAGNVHVAPRTELERQLTGIWQEILRRERVGIRDDFFALGGHSLLALTIASRVATLLQLQVSIRWLFEHRTIEALAQRIESHDAGPEAFDPMPPEGRQPAQPVSFGQQGMWLLQQTLPDPAAYNVPTAIRLSGRVDRERVRASLRVILGRHEVLRTGLVQQREDLVQHVADAMDFPLPWREVDLRSASIPEQASALRQVLEEDARRAFDLAQPPLWRVAWVQLAEDEQVLAFTFHHSITDEWSTRLLIQELSNLYDADGIEERAHLPELPLQYADYAIWQRKWLRGKGMEAQREYWSEHLRNLPPDLELPGDLPTPLQRSGRGAIQSFRLAGEVVARLNALSREVNATSFMTALAAFQVWLFRYTGQSDQVVATPITGREKLEFQNLIGFFLNTLPIRARIEGCQGFREILRQVRQTVLDAFDHARLPFEHMVELAVKERNINCHPLHQVMFVFLEQGLPQLGLGQAQGQLVPMDTRSSKCDLLLNVMASEQGWNCQLEYASDRFTEEAAARMASHLKEMLEAISEDPQKPVDQLRLMPDSERHRILVEWNDSVREYPSEKCIQQLFEEQVVRTPDSVAVVFGDHSLTYRELNLRANQIAHHLRALGVGPDILVGLCVERSLEMVIALLGILKAGGAYVPLDPKLPLERLRILLIDINAPLALCQRVCRERLLSLAGVSGPVTQILVVEDMLESLEGSDPSDLPCTNKPGDLAYVMYTSGSTGKPKGVMVPHRGIVRLVVHPDYVELGPNDVLLQFAPLSFDASTFEIWGGLLNGAKLVLPPNESLDFTELGDAITGHRVTTLWLTAALFHQMMELQPSSLAGVRQLLAGGDVLSPARVRDYLEIPGHGRLINGYGPTENTTFTCCGVFDHAAQIGTAVSIGRPIGGTCVYILDNQGAPVPPGVVGELYAGGDGLARGYLNAPELTQERFVADPFNSDPRARLYKTGDLARWRPDGSIEFVGRADHQVKIRGFRIELGEIESALRCCPGVSDAVVIACESTSGDRQLLAYLVNMASHQPDSSTLRAQLASTLPEYMMPHSFVWLDQLPLTANGKLDRHKLPAPDQNPSNQTEESSQAKNLLELELIRIWEELFGRAGIGRHDNFFDLGGHSLQAARLALKIEGLVSHRIPIATLFQSPTIASFARRLTDDHWAPAWSSLVQLQPSGSKRPLFLIHGWGGDVYVFLDLARRMKADRPIYGVQAVGLDGLRPRHTGVEEMARHYAREIRSLQPHGPYHLAGYSLGGWIAYAVAQELTRQQEQVAFLGLLDTHASSHVPLIVYLRMILPYLYDRIRVHLNRWRELPLAGRSQYFAGRWRALCHHILRKESKQPFVSDPIEDIQKEVQPDYFQLAAARYRPSFYSGHVDLFAPRETEASSLAFWRSIARGGVNIHRVSGSHHTMLEDQTNEDLAKALEAVLSRADLPVS